MQKNNFLINPALIFTALWVIVIAGSNLIGNFYPYSVKFYLYMTTVFLLFSVVSMLVARADFSFKHKIAGFFRKPDILFNPRFLTSLYLGCMFISIFFQCLSHWLMVGEDWWLPAGLEQYRILVTTNGQTPVFQFTAVFNYFFFSGIPIFFLFKDKMSWLVKAVFIIFMLFFFYLSTSRSTFFVAGLMAFFFWLHIKGRYVPIYKSILYGGLILIALYLMFFVVGYMLGKLHGPATYFYGYFFSPSHALDQIINGQVAGSVKWYTFSFLPRALETLGIASVKLSLPDYQVPFSVNVYTIFGPYVLDYGLLGSLVWVAVFAFISGILFSLATKYPENSYFIFLSSLNLTILVLSVFYDYYTSSGFVWLCVIFGAVLFPFSSPTNKSG